MKKGKDEIRAKIRLCTASSILMLKKKILEIRICNRSHLAHFYVKLISP